MTCSLSLYLSFYTVRLQTWRVHCPIGAQIGLVITDHVREFCYSFDECANETVYSSRCACNWPFIATCLCDYTRHMHAVIILSITWLITNRIGLHSVRSSTTHKCLHVFVMSRSVVQGVLITQQEIQLRLIYNNTCYQLWQWCSDKSSHGRRNVLETTGTTSEK